MESGELANVGHLDDESAGLDVNMKKTDFEGGPRCYDDAKAKKWKSKVSKLTDESFNSEVCMILVLLKYHFRALLRRSLMTFT